MYNMHLYVCIRMCIYIYIHTFVFADRQTQWPSFWALGEAAPHTIVQSWNQGAVRKMRWSTDTVFPHLNTGLFANGEITPNLWPFQWCFYDFSHIFHHRMLRFTKRASWMFGGSESFRNGGFYARGSLFGHVWCLPPLSCQHLVKIWEELLTN